MRSLLFMSLKYNFQIATENMSVIFKHLTALKISSFKNVDGAMHFIYSHKYNTNSAEDSSDIN